MDINHPFLSKATIYTKTALYKDTFIYNNDKKYASYSDFVVKKRYNIYVNINVNFVIER